MHGPPAHCHLHHWSRDSHYFLLRSIYSAGLPWTTRTSRLPWFEYAHLCAVCHNRCYSAFCVEPTSQPSHPVATVEPSGRSPTWVAVTITYLLRCFASGLSCSAPGTPPAGTVRLAQVQCLVSVYTVFLWWLRTVCGQFAARLTTQLGVGCGVPRHQLCGRSAQCASAADYLDLVTHVAGVQVRSMWRPAQQEFWLVDGLRLCKTGRRSLGRSVAGGQQALRGGLTPRLHTLLARLATAGASVF